MNILNNRSNGSLFFSSMFKAGAGVKLANFAPPPHSPYSGLIYQYT